MRTTEQEIEYVLFGSSAAIEAFDTDGVEGIEEYIGITDWTTKAYPEGSSLSSVIAECGMWDEFSFLSEEEFNAINNL